MANAVPPEAEELISDAPVIAHLATCDEGRPHVAPVWYHYEDGTVEVLTTGKKLENIRNNPLVAVSIQKDEGGRTEWMVSLRGRATVVEGREEALAAARRINPKYPENADETAFPENVLVRIDVGSASYQRY